jgi:hypothetical protein
VLPELLPEPLPGQPPEVLPELLAEVVPELPAVVLPELPPVPLAEVLPLPLVEVPPELPVVTEDMFAVAPSHPTSADTAAKSAGIRELFGIILLPPSGHPACHVDWPVNHPPTRSPRPPSIVIFPARRLRCTWRYTPSPS